MFNSNKCFFKKNNIKSYAIFNYKCGEISSDLLNIFLCVFKFLKKTQNTWWEKKTWQRDIRSHHLTGTKTLISLLLKTLFLTWWWDENIYLEK